jgi:signal transduction histidine kinase
MRLKLFLSFTLIVLISVLLVAFIVRWGTVNEVRAYMVRGGMYELDELATQLETLYANNGSWQGADQVFGSGRRGAGGMGAMMNQRLLLADPSGLIVEDTQGTSIGETMSQSQRDNSIPLFVDGQTVGYLYAVGGAGFNSSNEQQLYTRLNRAVIIAGLVAGGLGLVLALVLAYTLLRPIRALTFASQKLAKGDLSQRVAIHSDDELATLGNAFNHMADSLQVAEESRRAMTADIAHELRTPLAVQRANLEALQDGVYPLSVENLSPVIEQNHLLTHLVDDLRTLALTDAGQINLERTPTDLTLLTQRVVELFQPQAAAQQVRLRLTTPAIPPKPLSLDPIRVEQMLSNLISNALRYTPIGGTIDVTIADLPDITRLTVHDSGPGIPEESLPFIFDRFYRADKARSRSEGGSGLGLAIARNLARAHGGDLTATNHASGGALFTLILPSGE